MDATTYRAFTPILAPLYKIRNDNKDIDESPITFLFSNRWPNLMSYILLMYSPNGINASWNAIT